MSRVGARCSAPADHSRLVGASWSMNAEWTPISARPLIHARPRRASRALPLPRDVWRSSRYDRRRPARCRALRRRAARRRPSDPPGAPERRGRLPHDRRERGPHARDRPLGPRAGHADRAGRRDPHRDRRARDPPQHDRRAAARRHPAAARRRLGRDARYLRGAGRRLGVQPAADGPRPAGGVVRRCRRGGRCRGLCGRRACSRGGRNAHCRGRRVLRDRRGSRGDRPGR